MNFKFASTPHIVFGAGKINLLPEILKKYGSPVLFITGQSSFYGTQRWEDLITSLRKEEIEWHQYTISHEPGPSDIDGCIMNTGLPQPKAIIAVGGGSVMDAGKAISAMWKINEPVKLFLEGVGDGRQHPGDKIPFIAVPTTSGTGSEATKNAVISEVGERGFKKSLRHDRFIPDLAVIDPALILDCPQNITAWSGMDAFTQLLESYLSTGATPLTDTIAESGLKRIARSLEKVVFEPGLIDARSDMAYAALCSGITLANAGLGTVHGFASSIGGCFEIPHGLICGTLMGVANEYTLNSLLKNDPAHPAVKKYTKIGRIFYGTTDRDEIFYAEYLINKIHDFIERFDIPLLGEFGFEKRRIDAVVEKTSCKNDPVKHDQQELKAMLLQRI